MHKCEFFRVHLNHKRNEKVSAHNIITLFTTLVVKFRSKHPTYTHNRIHCIEKYISFIGFYVISSYTGSASMCVPVPSNVENSKHIKISYHVIKPCTNYVIPQLLRHQFSKTQTQAHYITYSLEKFYICGSEYVYIELLNIA